MFTRDYSRERMLPDLVVREYPETHPGIPN
jgi:hypothetical protein